ncbi:MAG TPA: murein L,D-transpeptidase catalytic domain family protein [Lacibacter sp.]|nr:murein L,D-transpeptidase catalytic domain family protein [Lacibacter sp.]HMO88279.1 murein L,D-transpeptidase catalytic domain family protein [Lacibacter sp.]HMP87282.1 murein L,D-transpeptidase catalytic domain family protein [Lacibacter sp.]
MHSLKQILRSLSLILYPVKNQLMHLFRTNPVYMAVAALLFLQIPILIAGTDVAAHKVNTPEYLAALVPAVATEKSMDELILEEADSIYQALELTTAGLSEEAFEQAYKGYYKLREDGLVAKEGLLTIADFSKPSTTRRLFVVDMQTLKMLYHTYVAHGRNSGLQYANAFSNKPQSNKSSLGFYLTLDTYMGGNGYSLKLRGLEKGINDKAYDRAIVMHGSDYVSDAFARNNGYLGRSLGCPAVPNQLTKPIINTIKNGSVLFIYHPDRNYKEQSALLNS